MDQTLGKRIASNRKRLQLTQDQLAEQLGVTAQAVSKWENDQSCPDITILPRLADIFGISTDELLGRDAPPRTFMGEVVDDDDDDDDETEDEIEDGVHISKGGWEFHWDSGRKSALKFALLVLVVGGLTLASRILNWDVSFWEILWPTTLLVYGLWKLFSRFSVSRMALALVGGYYLVQNLGILSFSIAGELLFPVVILLFGLGLFIDAIKKPEKNRFAIHRRGGNTPKTKGAHREIGERFESSLSFGENTHVIDLDRVSSGNVGVSFGELTIDLTQCREIADGCKIEAACSFAELRLILPKTCRAVVNAGASFGAIEHRANHDPNANTTVYIEGGVSFGNMDILYR